MTKPIIKIHNVETGKIVEREMDAAEFEQYKADQLAAQAKVEAKAEADAAKAAAQAKLAALGLTTDDLKALGL